MSLEIWQQSDIVAWSQFLLDSYDRLLQRPLLDRQGSPEEQSRHLFFAPFVVVSHGLGEDPIFNYGNQTALDIWELTWPELIQTPSRKTAELSNREERSLLLDRVARQGYVENYQGVRISKSGKRFLIQNVTVWNLLDDRGTYQGQAATFRDWTFL